MSDKIRVDMAHLTPQLLADAGELLGMSFMDAMQGPKQPLAIAAIAAVQNGISFDVTRVTDMTDFDVVGSDAEGEALAATNGGEPQPSPVSGV